MNPGGHPGAFVPKKQTVALSKFRFPQTALGFCGEEMNALGTIRGSQEGIPIVMLMEIE